MDTAKAYTYTCTLLHSRYTSCVHFTVDNIPPPSIKTPTYGGTWYIHDAHNYASLVGKVRQYHRGMYIIYDFTNQYAHMRRDSSSISP